MEPRPHAPRPSHGQQPAGPGRSPEETGAHQQPDPTTVVAPPRADYDYSPLDLAPPGQRRKRQLVAAGIGGVVLILLIGVLAFAFLALNEDDDDNDGTSDLAALQTQIATMEAAQIGTPETDEEVNAPVQSDAEADNQVVAEVSEGEAGGDADDSVVAETDGGEGSIDTAGGQAAPDTTETNPQANASTGGGTGPSEAELEAQLPDQGIMPQGLDAVDSSSRTQEDVAGELGGTREAEQNLEAWGWSANVVRSFSASDPASLNPDATTNITASLHGFANDEAAAEALVFYSDILLGLGYVETEVAEVGATSRMLTLNQEDGGTTVAFYIQQGPVLYRIGGYSPAGDPTTNVVNVAQSMLGG